MVVVKTEAQGPVGRFGARLAGPDDRCHSVFSMVYDFIQPGKPCAGYMTALQKLWSSDFFSSFCTHF